MAEVNDVRSEDPILGVPEFPTFSGRQWLRTPVVTRDRTLSFCALVASAARTIQGGSMSFHWKHSWLPRSIALAAAAISLCVVVPTTGASGAVVEPHAGGLAIVSIAPLTAKAGQRIVVTGREFQDLTSVRIHAGQVPAGLDPQGRRDSSGCRHDRTRVGPSRQAHRRGPPSR